MSNSSFVLDSKFWLVLVEGSKVNSLSYLKNGKKNQDLLLNGKFHLFLTLPEQGSSLEEKRGGEVEPKFVVFYAFPREGLVENMFLCFL